MEERLEITPESKAGCLQGLLPLTTTAMLFKCSYWTETRHLPFSVSTPNIYLLISQKSVSFTNTECLRVFQYFQQWDTCCLGLSQTDSWGSSTGLSFYYWSIFDRDTAQWLEHLSMLRRDTVLRINSFCGKKWVFLWFLRLQHSLDMPVSWHKASRSTCKWKFSPTTRTILLVHTVLMTYSSQTIPE